MRRLLAADARGAALLTLGTVGSGVLAYAFNAVAARALGPEGYGPIAVLWALLFLLSVVLFRPVEQTLSRGIAERLAERSDPRPVTRSAGRLAAAVTGVVVLAIVLLWKPLTDGLFEGVDALTAALAAGIAGYALSFYVRGVASGLRWYSGYGNLLLADGGVRLVLAVPLLFVASQALAGVAVAAAAFGGALSPFLTRTWLVRKRGEEPLLARLRGGTARPFDLPHALAFAGPAAAIAACDQVLVSGGALLVALAGGAGAAEAAGVVFAATMLVRAPVFLFQGFAAVLLPSLTRFQALGDEGAFRRRVLRVAGALAAFALVLTAGTLAVGPESMRVLYGPGFEVGRIDLTLLAAGVGFYLAAATFSQGALARGMAGRAALIWTLAAATFVGLELLMSGDSFHRVAVAFLGASLLMCLMFAALMLRAAPVVAGDRARPRSSFLQPSPGPSASSGS